MSLDRVLRRRAAERDARVDLARAFVQGLPPTLDVQAAVVFGSVARGDFNRWSDVDLLIIATDLPRGYLDRCEALGARPPGLQPIAWTPAEWEQQRARGNPMVAEALAAGVWLAGSPEKLTGEAPGAA